MRRRLILELKPDRPKRCLIELEHHKQKRSWDCGISCVLMVLRSDVRTQLAQNFAFVCKDEGFNKSIWTIDLCYLLARLGVQQIFYTITMGVHPGYRTNSFYKRVLSRDEKRVNERFDLAPNSGIKIRQGSLDSNALFGHLKYGPAIVLTNARLLSCDFCKLKKAPPSFGEVLKGCCLPWVAVPYQGHFVVLCGYDVGKRKVYYRNPSLSDRVCVMSLEGFERARRSYGTDEDVILVYL